MSPERIGGRPPASAKKPNLGGLVAALAVIVLGAGLTGAAAIALQQHRAEPAARGIAPVESETEASAPSSTNKLTPADSESRGDTSGTARATELASITAAVDTAWADAVAVEAGIPARAMRAYAGAAIRVKGEYPQCGVGWNTLAGIGFVESEHGTIGGSAIGSDGVVRPAIIGVPLDGTSTDRIPDTDGGALDGDEEWDRAVGPMQFIPSTWAEWAADGDGDGIANPQSIDDSVLAAARYLCGIGGDLTQPDRWIAAIAAYNNTVEYNHRVADAADHYAAVGAVTAD